MNSLKISVENKSLKKLNFHSFPFFVFYPLKIPSNKRWCENKAIMSKSCFHTFRLSVGFFTKLHSFIFYYTFLNFNSEWCDNAIWVYVKSEACNVMLRYLIMRMNQILSCENLFTRSMKITQQTNSLFRMCLMCYLVTQSLLPHHTSSLSSSP